MEYKKHLNLGRSKCITALVIAVSIWTTASVGLLAQDGSPIAAGASVRPLATGFIFIEGPASDTAGNLFFTDIPNERIYRLVQEESVTVMVFREDSSRANGLWVGPEGDLLVCEMGQRQVTAISPDDGNHVFYITPDLERVIQVTTDLARPNDVIGTSNGSCLYVADHGGRRTSIYDIAPDGRLRNQRLFVAHGSDGMTLDVRGNVYLTGNDVTIYNSNGNPVGSIAAPEPPANLAFGGADGKTLFITARTSLYAVEMTVTGQ